MGDGADIVRKYLKAQNLEQLGDVDGAVELYEAAVAARFDSTGPYDRLIFLYAERAQHRDVVRIAEAAMAQVQTYEEKRAWYERMRAEALKAQRNVPHAASKKRPR